jgi:hypothetical protein
VDVEVGDRIGELGRVLLGRVVSDVQASIVDQVSEVRFVLLPWLGRLNRVSAAVKDDARDGDARLCGQAVFAVLVGRVSSD